MTRTFSIILLCLYVSLLSNADFLPSNERPVELLLKRRIEGGTCSVLALRHTQVYRGLTGESSRVSKLPAVFGDQVLSIIASDRENIWSQAYMLCEGFVDPDIPINVDDLSAHFIETSAQNILATPSKSDQALPSPTPKLDIEPLLQSGSESNRVDLVFFSDGYTIEEKAKFINDAKRLADDISNNQTFNTVKPLLNFWAAFTPSNQSGIGVGGKPKNTTYGLYRDGTELRGVYYSKPEVARAACLSMGDQCDYPILMGNDPLYGGLGGEFTVITPSLANGALVLRHELGHSIINVGEEYDGGFAYYGVNAAHDPSEPVPWAHWLSNPDTHSSHSHEDVRVERSIMPMQAYPWTMLNTSAAWSIKFNSSGQYARHLVRFSLSGLPNASDLIVTIDGKNLGWTPRQDIGVDRWHYDVHRNITLNDGEHEVKFELKNQDREGTAQLCSTEVLEFGTDDEFVATPGYYGIFPTFSETNTTTYRPTNEDCLMRIVTTPNLCKACLEGLWLSLLRRVDFIDDVVSGCEIIPGYPTSWKRTLDLRLVPLAQFRNPGESFLAEKLHESYSIVWFKNGAILDDFKDKTHVEIDDADGNGVGVYTVEVTFKTDEVRVDPDGLLSTGGDYNVVDRCGSFA